MSIRYTERLAEAGIDASLGFVGDSYDNARAETINGLHETELSIHCQAIAVYSDEKGKHPSSRGFLCTARRARYGRVK